MMAILFFTFLAFLALVIDGGWILFEKRRMQGAADAAAWGGAQEVLRERRNWQFIDEEVAGKEDAKRNGYEHGVNTIDVAINRPPTSGDFQTDGFVEAVLTREVPTFFMGALLGKDTATIRARAVAGAQDASGVCIQALEPTAQRGIQISGTPNVSINCAARANSCNKNDSLSVDGSANVVVDRLEYCYEGAFTGDPTNVTCNDQNVDCPSTAAPLPDVLSGRGEPDWTADAAYATAQSVDVGNGDVVVLNPGLYDAAAGGQPGIKISQGATVTFNPGFYVIDGMSISGDAATTTVTGTDVTFFSIGTNNLVSINGGWVDFDAPDMAEGYQTGRWTPLEKQSTWTMSCSGASGGLRIKLRATNGLEEETPISRVSFTARTRTLKSRGTDRLAAGQC
ncbi:MAG: pilus assembly protein TadG-related protein [Acidobacteria bacterium]|nr:pilus assembly protein TadG-related protein [Acidobacteriota bacterium]